MRKRLSFAIAFPEYIADWDFSKNTMYSPDEIACNSSTEVYWKCHKCNHEWFESVKKRVTGKGCSECYSRNSNKIPGGPKEAYFSSLMRILSPNDDWTITHPEILSQWHPTKNSDTCPNSVDPNKTKVWWLGKCGHSWQDTPMNRIMGHGCLVCDNSVVLVGFNDLATTNPVLALDWHPTKNGTLTPQQFTAKSSAHVYWKCHICDRVWDTDIRERADGRGCSTCSARARNAKKHNLALEHPDLAMEWYQPRNGNLSPDMYSSMSGETVYWECIDCGYIWPAIISNRARGNKCPCCTGRVLVPGKNDLATRYPEKAADWDQEKNGDITPSDVMPFSNEKYYWKCKKCGYERKASPNAYLNGNCRGCSGKALVKGKTDLATTNPKLAAQWHSTKNGSLTPEMVTIHYSKKVWWEDERENEFPSTINKRLHSKKFNSI